MRLFLVGIVVDIAVVGDVVVLKKMATAASDGDDADGFGGFEKVSEYVMVIGIEIVRRWRMVNHQSPQQHYGFCLNRRLERHYERAVGRSLKKPPNSHLIVMANDVVDSLCDDWRSSCRIGMNCCLTG